MIRVIPVTEEFIKSNQEVLTSIQKDLSSLLRTPILTLNATEPEPIRRTKMIVNHFKETYMADPMLVIPMQVLQFLLKDLSTVLTIVIMTEPDTGSLKLNLDIVRLSTVDPNLN